MKASILRRKGDGVLFLRISHRGTERLLSTGVQARAKDWNPKTERFRSEDSANEVLTHYLRLAEEAKRIARVKGPAYTADAVQSILKRLLAGEESDDFLDYARGIAGQKERKGQYGTAISWKAQLDKLELFAPGLTFSEITPEFLRRYETWLLTERGNRSSTAHKAIKILRAAYYTALREGRTETNPFLRYSLPSSTHRPRERLSEDEIEILSKARQGVTEAQALARDLFLFSVYTGGMRFSDVVTLTRENIRDGRLIYTSRKTGRSIGVPLIPEAQDILELFPVPVAIERRGRGNKKAKVFPVPGTLGITQSGKRESESFPDSHTSRDREWGKGQFLNVPDRSLPMGRESGNGSYYLFPVLRLGVLHKEIDRANARTNRNLKRLAAKLGLRPISFHMARHTLADLLRRKGWSVYDISKLLGHRHISQTQTYLASLDQVDLDKKFEQAFKK